MAATLGTSPYVDLPTIDQDYYSPSEFGVVLTVYLWKDRGRGLGEILDRASNIIFLHEGTVLLISLRPDIDYTLGDVVAQFGEPEGVYVWIDWSSHPGYIVYYEYPSQGLTFESHRAFSDITTSPLEEGKVLMEPEMQVTQAHYYEPTDYQTALTEVFYNEADRTAAIIAGTHPWRGFVPMPYSETGRR